MSTTLKGMRLKKVSSLIKFHNEKRSFNTEFPERATKIKVRGGDKEVGMDERDVNVCKLFPFIPILLLSFSYGGAPVALRYLWLVNNQKKREKNDFKQNLILKSQSSAKSVKCRANRSKLLTSSAILSINWS